MNRTALLLCVLALPLPAPAATFADLLAHYRAAAGCQGPAYDQAVTAANALYTAYHVTAPTSPVSVPRGRAAAGWLDDLAATEAEKGCKSLALETWRFVIRAFDGPVFADQQRRAVFGIRAIRAD